MVDVIPGILEKDIEELEKKVGLVVPYAGWIHIDVADNTLVPAETVSSMPALAQVIKKFRKNKHPQFEVHLMVSKPELFLKSCVAAGFSRVIAHVECDSPRVFLAEARTFELELGLAIDADTDFSMVEPFLEEVDCVLVMTSEAGSSGQVFQPETLEKIKTIHRNLPELPIEADGGINDETAKIVKDAGAIRLVSTSYIFQDTESIQFAIVNLQNA